MLKFNPSISGMSIFLALGLGLWEWYFFFYRGHWWAPFGWFTTDRLGFNLAWLAVVYISFQLLSIPFALRASKERFIGVLDGLAIDGTTRGLTYCDSRETGASGNATAVGGRILAVAHRRN